MKKSAKILAWIALTLVSVVVALAQAPNIVTYEGEPDASTKRPQFTNAVIAIDLPEGQLRAEAITHFRRLGARQFVEAGPNPCGRVTVTAVCMHVQIGRPMQTSSSGQISQYGNSGGYSTSASFGGELYPVTLIVSLVVRDGDKHGSMPPVLLGQATWLAPVGSGSSSAYSYGRDGSGSFTSTESGDLNSTLGNAIHQDMNALLFTSAGKGFWGTTKTLVTKGLSAGTPHGWVPGARDTVHRYFGNDN